MAVAKSYSLSRLLDVPYVVFLGASLSDRALLDATANPTALAYNQARFEALGFTGTLSSRAVSGSRAADLMDQLEAEITARGSSDLRDTLFIIDFGGNDVTADRPYDAAEYDTLTDLLDELRIRLTEVRAHWLLLPITRRNYPTGTTITQDQTDTAGSLPYNTAVVYPYLETWADKLGVDAEYALSMYELVRLHPGLLSTDGIHWFSDQDRLYSYAVLTMLAEYLQGRRGESLAGKSFGLNWTNVTNAMAEPGTYTTTPTAPLEPQVFNNINRGRVDIVDLEGNWLPGVRVSVNAFTTTGTSGDATAETRIADTRFGDNGILLTHFANISGANTFQVDISGLGAGTTGDITIMASRDAADAIRKTDFTVQGVTVTLDAASNAVSNQATFAFTADADGHVRITGILNVASSSTNGYLGGLIVDIDA